MPCVSQELLADVFFWLINSACGWPSTTAEIKVKQSLWTAITCRLGAKIKSNQIKSIFVHARRNSSVKRKSAIPKSGDTKAPCPLIALNKHPIGPFSSAVWLKFGQPSTPKTTYTESVRYEIIVRLILSAHVQWHAHIMWRSTNGCKSYKDLTYNVYVWR